MSSRRLAAISRTVELTLRPHAESLPRLESLAAPLRAGETIRVAVIGTLVAVKGSRAAPGLCATTPESTVCRSNFT